MCRSIRVAKWRTESKLALSLLRKPQKKGCNLLILFCYYWWLTWLLYSLPNDTLVHKMKQDWHKISERDTHTWPFLIGCLIHATTDKTTKEGKEIDKVLGASVCVSLTVPHVQSMPAGSRLHETKAHTHAFVGASILQKGNKRHSHRRNNGVAITIY